MKPSKLNRTRGFTIIELLIAMTISCAVISAVYSLFISQNRSYAIQEQVADMQQNARVAMNMIVRDVRMAGLGVAANQAFVMGNVVYDYDTADNFQTSNDPDRLDADGIMIRRADSPPIDIIIYKGSAANLSVCNPAPDPSYFQVGDILTITEGNNHDTIEVTQIATTSANPCPLCCASGQCDKINFSPGKSAYNNPGGLADWASNGTVALFAEIAYFIDPDGPALRRSINGGTAQLVAENIEDLQFAYQFSGDTNWYNTVPVIHQVQDIRSVRINLLARTKKIDPDFKGNREALEDHAQGNADNYRRRLLTTIIDIRNMGL